MPFNGSGTYSLPAGNPVVTNTTISSTTHNNTTSDIATALSSVLVNDGQQVITGAQDFNGNELILDVDGDTSITADTDDQIDFKTGGTDRFRMDGNGVFSIGGAPAIGGTAYIEVIDTTDPRIATRATTGGGQTYMGS